jgi:DNA transformation protein
MDAESLKELFREFAPVSVRRMFGGQGVFVDGLMIGLVSDDLVYLKADEDTIPGFKRQGMKPFSYRTNDGRRTLTSYWRMPDFLYDDPGDLAIWARAAHGVALRADERKRKSSAPAKEKNKTRTGKPRKAAKSEAKPVRRPSPTKRKQPRGRSRT